MTFKDLPVGVRFCFPVWTPADHPLVWQKTDAYHYQAVWGDELDSYRHSISNVHSPVIDLATAQRMHRQVQEGGTLTAVEDC